MTSWAIHHLGHERKRSIYKEIFSLLNHGGIFCNLEHVDSPTPNLHEHFLNLIGDKIARFVREEYSDKLLSMETQLRWLRQIGLVDVDCYWTSWGLGRNQAIKASCTRYFYFKFASWPNPWSSRQMDILDATMRPEISSEFLFLHILGGGD